MALLGRTKNLIRGFMLNSKKTEIVLKTLMNS